MGFTWVSLNLTRDASLACFSFSSNIRRSSDSVCSVCLKPLLIHRYGFPAADSRQPRHRSEWRAWHWLCDPRPLVRAPPAARRTTLHSPSNLQQPSISRPRPGPYATEHCTLWFARPVFTALTGFARLVRPAGHRRACWTHVRGRSSGNEWDEGRRWVFALDRLGFSPVLRTAEVSESDPTTCV
jgi:hypothetical protein